tara:strand:- start:4062 stop:4388 length:327 start_codon:yes stop_codon:yes gene_type:complete
MFYTKSNGGINKNMGQYDERVERQRLLLAAEDWANGIKSLHSHRLKSMWYDDRPQDTDDGQFVTDKQYNGGEIERTIYSNNGNYLGTFIFGKRLTGDDLISEYTKYNH